MGAQVFRMTVSALVYPDAVAAEARAWKQAGGTDLPYTGTLSAKSSVMCWPAEPFDFADTGLSVETITCALQGDAASVAALEAAAGPDLDRLDLARMQDVYDGKYGPAVMFRHRYIWVLCGWAAC